MAKISRFEVYGPLSTLKRIGEAMYTETPHIHHFVKDFESSQSLRVYIYEDRNTAVHCSRCVTCIVSENSDSVEIEIADVGKQSGFLEAQNVQEPPVFDQLLDFILDFSKKFGLTVQRKREL